MSSKLSDRPKPAARLRLLLGLVLICYTGCSPASELGQGLLYKNDRIRSVPWSIHVLQIDRSRNDFKFLPTLGEHEVLGLGPLSEQVRAIPSGLGHPLCAINGDFFHLENETYPGDPRGALVVQGELISSPDGKSCFWIDNQGMPHVGNLIPRLKVIWPSGESIPCGLNEERRSGAAVLYTSRVGSSTRTGGGTELVLERAGQNAWLPLLVGKTYNARVRQVRERGNSRLSDQTVVLSLGPSLAARLPALEAGSLLKLSLNTSPDLRGTETALGGGPILVHQGEPQQSYDHKSFQRHPRAALGWNSKYYFLVAVDGRQPGLSLGMTLDELAAYLVKLGCEEAMNLDGGASAELWVEGRVVNSPCFGRERSTGTSLVLLQTPKAITSKTALNSSDK